MTNKNKKNRSQEAKTAQEEKRKSLKEQAEKDKLASTPLTEVNPYEKPSFTKGQFNLILLLGVGFTKIMNISKSIRAEQSDVATHICTQYFIDDDVCLDDGVNTFLRYKLVLALQVLCTVGVVSLQCWKSEDVLLRYTGCVLATPVMITSCTFAMDHEMIDQRTAWYRDIIMGFILTAFTIPPKTHIPFVTGKKQTNNTFQSSALMVFVCFYAVVMLKWARALLMDGPKGIAETLFEPTYIAKFQVVSPALSSVAYFFLIDKLTIAVSIFFSWFYLKEGHHRVSISPLRRCCCRTVAINQLESHNFRVIRPFCLPWL